MVSDDGSSTGVPVIPSGLMFPQGNDEARTGCPTTRFHNSLPVIASKAWTASSSVATNNVAVFAPGARQYSGWAYIAPATRASKVRSGWIDPAFSQVNPGTT